MNSQEENRTDIERKGKKQKRHKTNVTLNRRSMVEREW